MGLHGADSVEATLERLVADQRPDLREELTGLSVLPMVFLLGVPPLLLWLTTLGFLWVFYSTLAGPNPPIVEFPMPSQ